ncbi:sugar phosphate nucleotidyltransferase [Haliscomenobacter hydrossis]|nr:sugar phosphate nucleotidyltransferase [Haliscomenobacter hydrossis]
MKIIIPMAGRGSRLRPHTLTIPKPLLPIAGKPIVQRIVEGFSASFSGAIEEVAFVIGDFGKAVELELQSIAELIGAKCSIYYQDLPLGPAHAIYCARESLNGPCLVAFADTLFKADFHFDLSNDGLVWVKQVENPASFGVVKTNDDDVITDFVEKSPVFISDQAIVGIYYFRDGLDFRNQVEYLIDNVIKDKGEFQITSVLEIMKNRGTQFRKAPIEEWLDCGNMESVLETHRRILELKENSEHLISSSASLHNTRVIPPCYIGANTQVRNAIIGPFVSIGSNCIIENAVIENSIIQNEAMVRHVSLQHSMLGNQSEYAGSPKVLNMGDFTTFKE